MRNEGKDDLKGKQPQRRAISSYDGVLPKQKLEKYKRKQAIRTQVSDNGRR